MDVTGSGEARPDQELAPPGVPPPQRDPRELVVAGGYRAGDAVWVFEDGGWRPGVVVAVAVVAVQVRYRQAGQRGEAVDTVTADKLALRRARTVVNLRPDLVGWVLDLAPDQWHAMPRGSRLALRVELVEPEEPGAGKTAWVWVTGWLVDPWPETQRVRELVRAEALPPAESREAGGR